MNKEGKRREGTVSLNNHQEQENITEDSRGNDAEPTNVSDPDGEQSIQKKKFFHGKKAGIIAGGCLVVLLLLYLGGSVYFRHHFYFRSTVNGVSASGASVEKTIERIQNRAEEYELTIVNGEDQKETILPQDVDLAIEIRKDEVMELADTQNGFAWVKYLFVPRHYVLDDLVTYNEGKLEEKIQTLDCVQNPDAVVTENATFEYKDQKFQIVDEVYGDQIDGEKLKEALENALLNLDEELDLEKDNCYIQPAVKADSPELREAVKTMNTYADLKITYQVGNETEVIPKDTIASWLFTGEALDVQFHQDLMTEFVNSMAKKYNTSGKAKSLKTSYGATVTVPAGNYGWKIDVSGEVAQLISDLTGAKDVNRDFVYAVKANSRGENDYGDSYVEINLTAQHMFLYKNGQKILESDFVSGDLSEGNGTHTGAYKVTYKERDAVLKGRDYRTPVDYWMPFNGGEGMHDANWRRTFGGQIYKTDGSHGCINLPPSVAAKVYENISAGYPVLVYTLEGTEQKSKTDIANENAARAVVDSINGIGAVSLERNDYIRGVRAQYDALNSNAKKLVGNYQTLVDAENQLNALWQQVAAAVEQQAKEQAAAVLQQIKTAVDQGTPEAITSAVNAYESLSQQAKGYVQQDTSGYYQRFVEKRNELGI